MTAKHKVVECSTIYRNCVQKSNQFLHGEQIKESMTAPNVNWNRKSEPDDVCWKGGQIVDSLV